MAGTKIGIVVWVAMLAGCIDRPPASVALDEARLALVSAQAVKADSLALPVFRAAHAKLQRALGEVEMGNDRQAYHLATEARVTAQLAEARAEAIRRR